MVLNHSKFSIKTVIKYDPWHPPCSIYAPDSLFPQSLSKFSLIYLLAWHPPFHTPYMGKPCKNGCIDQDAILGDLCGPKEPCIRQGTCKCLLANRTEYNLCLLAMCVVNITVATCIWILVMHKSNIYGMVQRRYFALNGFSSSELWHANNLYN